MDQFIRGTVADEMEDYYRAVFHYQEALRFDSTSAFVYVALAQDYVLLGRPAAAMELLNKALRLQPESASALELKAMILRGTGNIEEARDVVHDLVRLHPDSDPYRRQLLALELGLGNFSEADRIYSTIVKDGGDTEVLSRQILAIYLAAGESERAITLLERLVKSDTTDAGLYYALGTSYLQMEDSAAGELNIRRARSIEPDVSRYWTALAYLQLSRSDYAGTIALVDSALEIIEPDAPLYSLKGTALNRMGRQTEAVAALEHAVALDSTSFTSMGSLALLYDEMDSVEQAVFWYERAIALSDSAPVYLNNLAYTYSVRGMNLDKARVLSERAVAIEPENGAYLDTMGWIEYGLENYKSALHWLKKALKTTSDSATTLEHIGDVYVKLGSEGKADIYYRRALELDPDNETLRLKISR